MASRGPCFCSVCVLDNFEDDDGNLVPGSLQTSKTRKQHEISDAKRAKRTASRTTRVETQVIATTLGGREKPEGSSIVRPRDSASYQQLVNPHEPDVRLYFLSDIEVLTLALKGADPTIPPPDPGPGSSSQRVTDQEVSWF